MSYFKFTQDDIFYNRIKTFPKSEFYIYNSKIYYNNKSSLFGEFNSVATHVSSGFVSLHELNVDKDESAHTYDSPSDTGQKTLAFPFITKEGSITSFKTTTTSGFNNDFLYGATISSSYPLSSSITRERFSEGSSSYSDRKHIYALRNTFDYYKKHSEHHSFSSSYGDKESQELSLISIPSIFFGSSIRKGSVDLKFYITGSLVGQLKDENRNGELIQVLPKDSTGSGSVAGTVLYNEGFIVLTGSWDLNDTSLNYLDDATNLKNATWKYFGIGMNDSFTVGANASSSFYMGFEGTNYIPTITMLTHAKKGLLNHSNNPSFIKHGQTLAGTSSAPHGYSEPATKEIVNIASSSHCDYSASFKKETFISKIGIYDKDRNLIGIANLATPIRKEESDEYTIKLKLDI